MEHVIVALLELEHVLATVVMKGIIANVRCIFVFVQLRNLIVAYTKGFFGGKGGGWGRGPVS